MSAAAAIPNAAGRGGSHPADTATPLLTLVRVELRKMVDTRAGRWLLISIGLILLAVMAIGLFTGSDKDLTFTNFASIAQFPVAVLLPVLGVLAATSEWSQRTVLTTFSLTPARGRIIVAKVLAAIVLAVVVFLMSMVLAAVAALIAPAFGDPASDWSLSGMGEYLVFDLLNMLMGVALGSALLSSGLAIVLFFVLPNVWSGIVGAIGGLDGVQRWFDTNTSWIHLVDGDGVTGENWAQIFTTALLFIALPMVIGTVRILRKEVD